MVEKRPAAPKVKRDHEEILAAITGEQLTVKESVMQGLATAGTALRETMFEPKGVFGNLPDDVKEALKTLPPSVLYFANEAMVGPKEFLKLAEKTMAADKDSGGIDLESVLALASGYITKGLEAPKPPAKPVIDMSQAIEEMQ